MEFLASDNFSILLILLAGALAVFLFQRIVNASRRAIGRMASDSTKAQWSQFPWIQLNALLSLAAVVMLGILLTRPRTGRFTKADENGVATDTLTGRWCFADTTLGENPSLPYCKDLH